MNLTARQEKKKNESAGKREAGEGEKAVDRF